MFWLFHLLIAAKLTETKSIRFWGCNSFSTTLHLTFKPEWLLIAALWKSIILTESSKMSFITHMARIPWLVKILRFL
jgi:hypothetical protein